MTTRPKTYDHECDMCGHVHESESEDPPATWGPFVHFFGDSDAVTTGVHCTECRARFEEKLSEQEATK